MNLITYIQRKLDATTMYRVVIYALLAISLYALTLSFFGILSDAPLTLIISFVVINTAAWLTHEIAVRVTKAPGNVESTAITALLLFLILVPAATLADAGILALIAASAVVLKYVVRYRLRHIANPAALILVVCGLLGYGGAAWWVGSRYLLPMVAIAGLLVILKTRRAALVLTYIVVSATVVTLYFLPDAPISESILRHFLSWPTIFFAAFMLTEPLGLPSSRTLQYWYAGIAAVLSSIPYSIGPLYGTPELALVVANIFTLIVDRPLRAVMTLVERVPVGKDTFEYRFAPNHALPHTAGQYLEWTLPHQADNRGIRRYFTIASAPGDAHISFAVRHLKNQSTWKRALEILPTGGKLYATQRAGDFKLRPNAAHHVFIAGGIGITPFVSMVRDAAAHNTEFDATLFYCNKTEDDIAFKELMESGVTTVHVLETKAISGLAHETGFITESLIKERVPTWQDATYYVSGPPGLVAAYETLLKKLGIPRSRIIVDYFPGLA